MSDADEAFPSIGPRFGTNSWWLSFKSQGVQYEQLMAVERDAVREGAELEL